VTQVKLAVSGSDDADLYELLATNTMEDSEGAKTSSADSQDSCKNKGENELLKKFALDFSKDDKVSRPISKQLVDRRWASKLGEDKVEEPVEKYDCPENCETLVAPKVNPESQEKMIHYRKKQDLRLSAICEGWRHYCAINSEAHGF